MNRVTQLPSLPNRAIDGHKGSFGRVLVVGGSDEMIGAPAFAGLSALRCGAGLVQVGTRRGNPGHVLAIAPECTGLSLGNSGWKSRLRSAGEVADAIVVGPGMGQSSDARSWLMELIRLDKPMVIDADGLNILSLESRWPKNFAARAVLTPHPGEMKRLAKHLGKNNATLENESDRIEVAVSAAKTFGQIVVLKGHRTVVADADRVFVNTTGNSALAKAGTGDVLSGIIATMLAQKMERFDAACLAVSLHGTAGEIAGEKFGLRCVLARDVIDAIPLAIAQYEKRNG